MSIDTSVPIAVEIPAEVIQLAIEEGVEEYLPAVLEMTRRLFPSASPFEVLLDEDPEIADDRHILISVRIPGTASEAAAARSLWCGEISNCCPAPSVCVFRIRLRLVP